MSQLPHMDFRSAKGKLVIGPLAIAPVVVLYLLAPISGCKQSVGGRPFPGTARNLHHQLSPPENPISEGGKWLNGQKDALDWTNVRTTPGFAFGTELGGKGRN